MIDRRELFRNALGAAAGAVVPSLWLPALVAPKPAAAAAGRPLTVVRWTSEGNRPDRWFTVMPYAGEDLAAIDETLRWIWQQGRTCRTMVMTNRQLLDVIRAAERDRGIIRINASRAASGPETIRLREATGYRHPINGDLVKIQSRRERYRDEIWFSPETRDTWFWDG